MEDKYEYKIEFITDTSRSDLSKKATELISGEQEQGWEYVPEGNCIERTIENITMFLTFRKPK